MGAFHVGGHDVRLSGLACREVVMAEGGQPVSLDPNGTYRVEQMYAQYFLAEPASGRPPLAFWHGGGMTGAAWETTPDGREGWLNAFLRRGWDAYLCDAVERGRAGYALVPEIWPEAPIVQTREDCYTRFRIGRPGTRPGSDSAYPNTQRASSASARRRPGPTAYAPWWHWNPPAFPCWRRMPTTARRR
ncbi:hypothetical protein G6F57_016644 [Rhizopus arrhizus]|nr:hypothetical protein G6F57_016644 [Rhizopus arrhizus]